MPFHLKVITLDQYRNIMRILKIELMQKENIPDIGEVKKLETTNIATDIRTWLSADESRTQKQFAELAGISLRTLESILGYDGTGKEPNWRRTTREGIMKVLGCESHYTPNHKIK